MEVSGQIHGTTFLPASTLLTHLIGGWLVQRDGLKIWTRERYIFLPGIEFRIVQVA